MIAPMANLKKLRTNRTLHGRSVYRPKDVPGHNVFKGYSTWATNGHHGVGDGVDLFGPKGTPVYAPFDGVQTVWRNDASKLEVIYIERADGATAVMAHINAAVETTGARVKAGQIVGHLRGDLSDPHLHFELKMPGGTVCATTGAKFKARLCELCGIA